MESMLNRSKGGLIMSTENYNETVLLPLLEKKVHDLTSALILAEARLQITLKEKAELEKKVEGLESVETQVG
jgi:hypothetical protein